MPDLTTVGKLNEKKTRSVVSAVLTKARIVDTGTYDLFQLPVDCLITDAYIIPKVAGQATLTASLGFDGGTELINAGAVSTTTVVKDAGLKLDTGTGKNVTIKFSAAPTQGEFVAIVEYIEYRLGNGKLNNYKPA